MRIYVEQFGCWWSFNPQNWKKMLEDMLSKTVNFNDYGQELKNIPYHNLIVYRANNSEGYVKSSYYPRNSKNIKVYSMLCDWDEKMIHDALKELK